jgi:bifunctional NMN adenylyltransferase/nudix hydrolase
MYEPREGSIITRRVFMKPFAFCVFIGRFQPFHLAHAELLKEALVQADEVIVVLGGSKNASNIKSPWNTSVREQMILTSLSKEDGARVKFVHMRDYLYNDNLWLSILQQKVDEITGESDRVALIGHEHDRSSYYLNLFPQWKRIEVKNFDKLPHATEIRQLYFTLDAAYKAGVPEGTAKIMEEFQKTENFKNLKDEYNYLREYRLSWEGAPFPPTFVTVDAVVIKSGHVLTVRRKGNPGRGLIALPGGFLNQNEKIQDGMLRELREETVIKMSKDELEKLIKDQRVFDHPDRSLRGRTVTHAFLINLGSGPLPQVKGSDDADKAWWMPLSECHDREAEFFEDHYHIISYFINRF